MFAILYNQHGGYAVYGQNDPRILSAIANGATVYRNQTTTIRVVPPGASHSDAWRNTLAEAIIGG